MSDLIDAAKVMALVVADMAQQVGDRGLHARMLADLQLGTPIYDQLILETHASA